MKRKVNYVQEEMNAHDKLPKAVRVAVANALENWSSVNMLARWLSYRSRGWTEERFAALVTLKDREVFK